MSTINEEILAEQEILEQAEVEKKLKSKKTPVDKTKKTGQKVRFKPADRIPEIKAPEGFRLKLAENTPERVRQLQQEGWEVASRLKHNIDADMSNYYKKMNDKTFSEDESIITHNELIAMITPEENAIAREEYYQDLTEKRTRAKFKPEDEAHNKALAESAQIKTTIKIN